MKLYDPKFVHFEWNDKLDGQYCFVANYIGNLIKYVNENNTSEYGKVSEAGEYSSSPFNCEIEGDTYYSYTFVYYDPNYNIKYAYLIQHKDIYYKLRNHNTDWLEVMSENIFKSMIDDPDYEFKIIDDFTELREAYEQGKTIQHMNLDGDWVDCDMPVSFVANHSYRIKPEKKINTGFGDRKYIADKEYVEKIKASFKNGETIAYRPFNDTMWNLISKYTNGEDYVFDFLKYEYKVVTELLVGTTAISKKDLEKDNDISHKLRDTVQESLSTSDLYIPFKDTDELIAYWDKHYSNGNRPEHTMPLIWVKGKETGNIYFITGYEENEYVCIGGADWWLNMKDLFEQCKFLDDKCCGKVKE